MSFIKHYTMTAKPGQDTALATALRALREQILPLAGCEGVLLLRDTGAPARFVFIERWHDADAHKAGGAALGKAAFGPVMAALAEPPDTSSLQLMAG